VTAAGLDPAEVTIYPCDTPGAFGGTCRRALVLTPPPTIDCADRHLERCPLAYGVALRVARFGNANEHADWETAHHIFTYTKAVLDAHAHRDL
jgi:hypothetical protein